jgi:DNA repair photolyase
MPQNPQSRNGEQSHEPHSAEPRTLTKGRGAQHSPPNRFEKVHQELDPTHWEYDAEELAAHSRQSTEFIPDESRSIVSENSSPDIPFQYSVNPYRGCEHGCAYCYARPTHEYLGLNAGLDFESRIFVKLRAPELLREFLARDRYVPQPIVFSGVTDCYQPAERRYQLTRQCLQVALETGQPVGIITKNALVARDIDLLRELAARRLVHVSLSLTTLDTELARVLEPRTSSPTARLRTIGLLNAAGVPVRVMTAPVIPGLNDSELPALLEAAATAGARSAGYTLLRLPLTVRPVFQDWLACLEPGRRARVEGLIRSTRHGKLNSAEFGERMRGEGVVAEQIGQMFRTFARKSGLDGSLPAYDFSQFRKPLPKGGQLRLF